MRLREIFENIYQSVPEGGEEFDGGLKTIGVCFGRFNPPHRGHREVWKAASTNPHWYVGTNESTSGPKDPLPYEVKLQCMAAVWPKVAGHVIPEQSLMTLASKIFEEHGENSHLKVYTDEEWLYKTLTQYNGVQGKAHGYYKFNQIDWVRTERLASATNLRAAVRSGNKAAFYKDAGVKPNTMITLGEKSYPMFDIVAHFLNMYPEKVAKGTKAAVAETKERSISKRQQQATVGLNTFGDSEHMNADYTQYRLGLAVAMADGTNPIPDVGKTWHGKRKTTHPYTQEEQDMLLQAYKAVGANHKDLNKGNLKSMELDTTNKISPVAKPKKNKYGV